MFVCLFSFDFLFYSLSLRGVTVLRLVRSSPEREARVRALGHCAVCSWARHFNVPLPTRVYKWVSAGAILGLTLRWASIPSSGEKKHSLLLHAAAEIGICSGLARGSSARMHTLPYSFNYKLEYNVQQARFQTKKIKIIL